MTADRKLNFKFVVRAVALSLLLAAILLAAWIFFQTPFARPLDPTPPPPTILAPRGEPPPGPVGLQEWARYQGSDYRLAGCGFLFRLAGGQIVAATTAHSLRLGDPDQPLVQIGLRIAGQAGFVAEFDTLQGLPGQARTGRDMTVDYVLLRVDNPVEDDLVLEPDPRGGPQAGERVTLFGGLGNGDSGQRALEGTVQSATDQAVWVLMDDRFSPALMSGSPFVSQHTGQVVGMVIAASPRSNRLLLAAHPIGSLVRLAESATSFPPLSPP